MTRRGVPRDEILASCRELRRPMVSDRQAARDFAARWGAFDRARTTARHLDGPAPRKAGAGGTETSAAAPEAVRPPAGDAEGSRANAPPPKDSAAEECAAPPVDESRADSGKPAAGPSSPVVFEPKPGPLLQLLRIVRRAGEEGVPSEKLAPYLLRTAADIVGPTSDLSLPEVKAGAILVANLLMGAASAANLAPLTGATKAETARRIGNLLQANVWQSGRYSGLRPQWRAFLAGLQDPTEWVAAMCALATVANGHADVDWNNGNPVWKKRA